MFAFTAIQGIGRRLANLLCKKAEIDLNQRCVAVVARRPPFLSHFPLLFQR
jgi:ribosomal protein S13